MDHFLKPERLDADPNSATATREWTHWFKTFENFLKNLPEKNLDKLDVLVNFVSPRLYEIISECTTYDDAKQLLQKRFVKPKNEIYTRYLLSSRKQQAGESLEEYLQALRVLAKDCHFVSVSATTYRDETIRDSFICI